MVYGFIVQHSTAFWSSYKCQTETHKGENRRGRRSLRLKCLSRIFKTHIERPIIACTTKGINFTLVLPLFTPKIVPTFGSGQKSRLKRKGKKKGQPLEPLRWLMSWRLSASRQSRRESQPSYVLYIHSSWAATEHVFFSEVQLRLATPSVFTLKIT